MYTTNEEAHAAIASIIESHRQGLISSLEAFTFIKEIIEAREAIILTLEVTEPYTDYRLVYAAGSAFRMVERFRKQINIEGLRTCVNVVVIPTLEGETNAN